MKNEIACVEELGWPTSPLTPPAGWSEFASAVGAFGWIQQSSGAAADGGAFTLPPQASEAKRPDVGAATVNRKPAEAPLSC